MHGSRHKGRLFYTYLLSFLLILIVPVVFSALVFNRARSILNAEAGRANELLLQQMKSFLDTVMGDVVQLNSMVTNHVTLGGMLFESLPVSNDEYYRAYRIASDLYGYDTSSTGSADLYVYLPKLDMVISPRGYFTTANYQMAQRPLLETGYDAWLGAFSDATAPRFRPSQSMSLSEVVSDTVEMVTPLPAWQRTGTPHGWLVVHVARDLFERIFAETAWTPDSVQLVYHQELGVVASSETVLDPREIEAAGAEALASGVVDRITLGDETYTVSAVRSDVVDWYYVSLVPGSLYAHRFAGLYRYALLALAVGVVIGWAAHLLDGVHPVSADPGSDRTGKAGRERHPDAAIGRVRAHHRIRAEHAAGGPQTAPGADPVAAAAAAKLPAPPAPRRGPSGPRDRSEPAALRVRVHLRNPVPRPG